MLRFYPSTATIEVQVGHTFDVLFVTNRLERVTGYEADLEYDPDALEFADFQWGTLLNSGSAVKLGPQEKEIGTITFGRFIIGDHVSGEFTVATITFEALALGTTHIDLADLDVYGDNYSLLASEASGVTVDVVEQPVPPPGGPWAVIVEIDDKQEALLLASHLVGARVEEVQTAAANSRT